MPIAPGTRLGQYEVQDFIGQGAMGLVFRAYHPQLERTAAVKVMQAISPDADTVARFRHEAQAIAQLRHPNIVDVYDFGEYQGAPYMIVEYVPGGSLATKMVSRELAPAVALKYLRGIAAGLDYAHSHGIVHRDVKPANVLLTADDTPVLADFGLAKLLQGNSLKSLTGVTTGTPAYMAPEQVTGGSITPAADRYSLATIAYEMLAGAIPFDGEALMEMLYAQVHRAPPAPSSRNAQLGIGVDGVLMRGLAKDPAARWESCTAFVDALAAAMNGHAAAAPGLAKTMVMAQPGLASTVPMAPPATPMAPRAVKPRPAAATVAVQFPQSPAPAVPTQDNKSRKRVIAIVAGALIALLILLGAGALLLASLAPTLTLSSYTVRPGEDIVVTATRVPRNQVGQIEMYSTLRTFPFRADSTGQFSLDITVPHDIGFGDHVVKLCYSGSCHAQQTLHVVSGVALISPTPVGNPTPSTTPSPTPTSSSTPPPGGGGGSSGGGSSGGGSSGGGGSGSGGGSSGGGGGGSGGGGGPTPTPTPRSTPTPPPNPCPTSQSAARLSESPGTVIAGVTTVTITGQNFTPNQPVTIRYYLGSALKRSWTQTVACSGGFSQSFTPGTLDVGNATVTANDAGGRSASVSFSILA